MIDAHALLPLTLAPRLLAAQPVIELAPTDPGAPADPAPGGDDVLLRGLTEQRLAASGTNVGGYGQLDLTYLKIGPEGPFDGTADLRRLVVFVSHSFDERWQVYSELEWEHAIACRTCKGSVEVEQAFIDGAFRPGLALRGGLVLVPFGIVNQWHEPSVYHGVPRPQVDTRVIPTTWRELAVGAHGALGQRLSYELYALTAPDPTRITAEGLAGASGQASLGPAKGGGVAGRLEGEPALGVVAGASFYGAQLGPNAAFYSADGQRLRLSLPLIGWELDARVRRAGLEARVMWAELYLPQADDLMSGLRADGSAYYPEGSGAVATRIFGGYAEVAYNVLRPLGVQDELLPLVRVERYNTQAAMPEGYEADPAMDIVETVFGLSWRPIPQVVAKADAHLRDRRYGDDELQFGAGLGFMF